MQKLLEKGLGALWRRALTRQDISTGDMRGSVMEHFNWGLCIAVIVVVAVTALIRRDGRRTKSGGGPSGWGDGGSDGGSDGD